MSTPVSSLLYIVPPHTHADMYSRQTLERPCECHRPAIESRTSANAIAIAQAVSELGPCTTGEALCTVCMELWSDDEASGGKPLSKMRRIGTNPLEVGPIYDDLAMGQEMYEYAACW